MQKNKGNHPSYCAACNINKNGKIYWILPIKM